MEKSDSEREIRKSGSDSAKSEITDHSAGKNKAEAVRQDGEAPRGPTEGPKGRDGMERGAQMDDDDRYVLPAHRGGELLVQ